MKQSEMKRDLCEDHVTHPCKKYIGDLFKQAREELHLSVQEIANKIHVRTLYLEAIEAGELDRLPSTLYATGFIRLYARHLHLDGDEILRRLELTQKHAPPLNAYIQPKPHIEPNRFVVGVSLLLSLLSLGLIFFVFWGKESTPIREEEGPSMDISFVVDKEHKEEDFFEKEEDLWEPLPDLWEVHDTLVESEGQTITSSKFTLFAHQNCWVEIRTTKKILFSGILKAGESYSLDNYQDSFLSVGNAPALELRLGEKTLPPLSRADRVVKNVSLSRYVLEQNS